MTWFLSGFRGALQFGEKRLSVGRRLFWEDEVQRNISVDVSSNPSIFIFISSGHLISTS
jgi:hypothetical protein